MTCYQQGLTALQCPVEEKHTDMTKIPWWPVAKYKQTGIKIAAAKQKEFEMSLETN